MADFYRLKSNVGGNSRNHPADVAFVQLVVKHNGGLIRPKGQSQAIDGRYHENLIVSVDSLFKLGPAPIYVHSKAVYDIENYHVIPSSSANFARHLPAKFQGQRLFVGGARASSLMLLPANTATVKAPLRVSANEVALPEPHKHQLLSFLALLSQRTHLVPRMDRVHVDDARFHVHVTFTGGKRIDLKTGAIMQPSENSWRTRGTSGMLDHLKAVIEEERLDRYVKSYWSLNFDDGLKLVTRKQFPSLRITRHDKRNILRSLPYPGKRPKIRGDAAQTCYAAYEVARNSGKLTPAQRKEFHACFGSDADTILRNEKTRKAACSTWLAKYTKLVAKQEGLGAELQQLKDAVDASEEARAAFEASGYYSLIAEMAFALVSPSVGKIGSKAAGKLSRAGPSNFASDKALGEGFASFGTSASGAAFFGVEDIADGLVLTVSIAAGLSALFAVAAPIAVALTVAAAIGGAADALWDFLQKRDQLDEATKEALQQHAQKAPELLAKIADNTHSIGLLLLAMKNEGCDRSIADFLEQGNHGISREDIATDLRSRLVFDKSDFRP